MNDSKKPVPKANPSSPLIKFEVSPELEAKLAETLKAMDRGETRHARRRRHRP